MKGKTYSTLYHVRIEGIATWNYGITAVSRLWLAITFWYLACAMNHHHVNIMFCQTQFVNNVGALLEGLSLSSLNDYRRENENSMVRVRRR